MTGGAGFIGSHVVDALIARGDRVAVIDNLSSGRRSNLARRRGGAARMLHEADVRDAGALAEIFAAARPEVVFHLAAQIDVRHSVEDPADDADANVLGTIGVLEAARAAGARRVVNTSTGGGLYGDADGDPDARGPPDPPARALRPGQVRRRGLLRAVHPAARAGRRCRCATATSTARARTCTARPAWWRSSAGALVDGRRPTVFGDGRQTRDWVEVGDVARANLLAADAAT